MWPTAVTIDGATIDLADVLAGAVIRHGRANAFDSPRASSCQLTLLGLTREQSALFQVGVSLSLDADGAPRFTGTITDAALDDDQLTVIATGTLATLFRYPIGATDWPAEAWSARVERVFSEAGLLGELDLLADPSFDPVLLPRIAAESDPITLADYLPALADNVGAAIADSPDGRILVQQLTARGAVAGGVTWEVTPDTIAWSEAACSWEDARTITDLDPSLPDPYAPLLIDPDTVVYVPTWVQQLELENTVTVRYGGDLEVTVSEPSSIDLFGPYPGQLDTELTAEADATQRASDRVTRRAFPRWAVPAATITEGLPLAIGRPAVLWGLPPSSPFRAFQCVLEGWVDTLEGGDPNGVWTCELALSDPIYSALALQWEDAAGAWNDVDPDCRWIDATTQEALTPTHLQLVTEV